MAAYDSLELITGSELNGMEKYFTDESRHQGNADALVMPRSPEEVSAAVAESIRRGWSITVSGARTGIAAGAVPDGGLLLSLERMNRILGLRRLSDNSLAVRCQAGVALSDLQKSVRRGQFADVADWDGESRKLLEQLRRQPLFFPPDPTEISASIGGIVACNASGAHSFSYGPVRPYVIGLSVVLADGQVCNVRRGQVKADGEGRLAVPFGVGCHGDFSIPAYRWPGTKNAAGYYSDPELDLIDLFIGSEGTLGIIVEVEIRLVSQPPAASANVLFLSSEDSALELVERLREKRETLALGAIEYFDSNSLSFLREHRRNLGATSGVPECLPEKAECAVYIDVLTDEEKLPGIIESLRDRVAAAGGDPAVCWSACEEDERERLRLFRHALPEAVNQRIATIRRQYPEVVKLGTDMAVPDHRLRDLIALYRSRLTEAGLPYLIFGHVGDNHLHVNILPENPDQYRLGRILYFEFARAVVDMGGSPAAEHGIGKLKKDFLLLLLGEEGVEEMRRIKKIFDPDYRLGKGTLLE